MANPPGPFVRGPRAAVLAFWTFVSVGLLVYGAHAALWLSLTPL